MPCSTLSCSGFLDPQLSVHKFRLKSLFCSQLDHCHHTKIPSHQDACTVGTGLSGDRDRLRQIPVSQNVSFSAPSAAKFSAACASETYTNSLYPHLQFSPFPMTPRLHLSNAHTKLSHQLMTQISPYHKYLLAHAALFEHQSHHT